MDPQPTLPTQGASTDGQNGPAPPAPRVRWPVSGGRVGRVLGLAGFGVLGLMVGVVGPFVGRQVVRWEGLPVPYGIVLALLAAAGLFVAGGKLFGGIGAVVPVLTWAVPVVALLLPRPEGDVVLANDGYGTAFLLLGVLVAAWNVVRALAAPKKVDRRAPQRP